MKLRQPVSINKRDVPVIIFKNNAELKECSNIQEAGVWLKKYTEDKFKRFSQISNGIWYGNTWSYNGATYSFTTDESVRLEKLEGLKNQSDLVKKQ